MVKNGLFGAELQKSKKIRKSTIQPLIYFRKQKALKCNLFLKHYKTLLKSGIILSLLYICKGCDNFKKGQKWTCPGSNLWPSCKGHRTEQNCQNGLLQLFYALALMRCNSQSSHKQQNASLQSHPPFNPKKCNSINNRNAPRLSGKHRTLEGSPKINRCSTHIFCHSYSATAGCQTRKLSKSMVILTRSWRLLMAGNTKFYLFNATPKSRETTKI